MSESPNEPTRGSERIYLHPELAAGRWKTFELCEQLANVGSEVSRTIRAWKEGRTERFEPALARALELFDLTAQDDRWAGPRRREILRAREEFVRLFFDDEPPTAESVEGLERYFFYFAVLARRDR